MVSKLSAGGLRVTRRQQTATRPETFLRGALMITLASFVSRFLGAFYKPIVARLFAPHDGHNGDAGLGLVSVPQPAYQIILSLSAAGLNIAISKLVAERMATGQYGAARRIFHIAMALLLALGLVMSAAFYAAADLMAAKAGRPETAAGFRAIAPAIFLVSAMAALRGLFQGLQQMTAYAMSQIYEQIIRVLAGVIGVWALTPRSVALGAAGYNLGAVAGAAFGLAYLLWLYGQRRPQLFTGELPARPDASGDSPWVVIRRILVLAAPVSLIGAAQPLILMVDSMLVINRLEVLGIDPDRANALFGQLSNAFSIIWLPSMLTHALYISLVPAITESLTRGNLDQARSRAATAYRMTLALGLPATVGLFLLPDAVYKLLFPGDGGPVLQAMALATLPMMLQQTTAGILQGAGDMATPIRNFLAGAAAKVALTWWWTASPLGASGAAYATAVAFGLAGALNIWALRRRWGILVGLAEGARLVTATALMGAAIWLAAPRLMAATGSLRLGGLLSMLVAAAVLSAALLAVGGVRRRDVEMIPKVGRWAAAALHRLKLLRE